MATTTLDEWVELELSALNCGFLVTDTIAWRSRVAADETLLPEYLATLLPQMTLVQIVGLRGTVALNGQLGTVAGRPRRGSSMCLRVPVALATNASSPLLLKPANLRLVRERAEQSSPSEPTTQSNRRQRLQRVIDPLLDLVNAHRRELFAAIEPTTPEEAAGPPSIAAPLLQAALEHMPLANTDRLPAEVICPICQEDLAAGCVAAELPCGHLHHLDCLGRWICHEDAMATTRSLCPTCRAPLFEPPAKPLESALADSLDLWREASDEDFAEDVANQMRRMRTPEGQHPLSMAAMTCNYPLVRHLMLAQVVH